MGEEIKKQHYLPFTYLKYFRCNENIRDRKHATIFRDDGTSFKEELVANQCYKKWFYRRHNTKESELGFQSFEKDWDECLNRIRAGHDESALIFMQMVMYHFRNMSIRMITQHIGRFEAVTNAVVGFIEQKILRLTDGVNYTDNPEHVTKFPWQVRLIKMKEGQLFTSDNPSVMTILKISKEDYGPFLLPVSPTELLVAIDKTKFEFKHLYGTKHDSYISNAYTAAQAVRHIYYHKPIETKEREDLWKFINKTRPKESSRGSFQQKIFRPSHVLYGQNKFLFLREKRHTTNDIARASK